jgi:tetratricopeptide (TPR) repeat protein
MIPHRCPRRACLAVFLLLGCAHALPAADEVQWRTDYARALREAQQKGRPLLVDVGTENCHWCKQLDVRTFTDPELVKMLNERCIPLKIDGNSNNYLVEALRIHSYPTLVFAGPDGSIMAYKEGFLEAGPLKEHLVRVLAAVGTPDWMTRDVEAATRAGAAGNHARAMALLRGVVEDGRHRPVQVKARQMLAELEQKAAELSRQAKALAEQGKTTEAIAAYNRLGEDFPGTPAARQGQQMVMKLASRATDPAERRKRQAAEVLAQAREDYRNQRFLICLDRCERLLEDYSDLPEAKEAARLTEEVKENPEWTRKACDQMGDRLGVLYLALADTWLRKGQPQKAVFYLQRVVKMFPGSRHAEKAQATLARLRGAPGAAGEKSK